MKTMISKIMLAVLVISTMPMHASLGKTVHNKTKILLQGIGNKAGSLALATGVLVGLLTAYAVANSIAIKQAEQDLERLEKLTSNSSSGYLIDRRYLINKQNELRSFIEANKPRWVCPMIATMFGALGAGAMVAFSKLCGYVGSKI